MVLDEYFSGVWSLNRTLTNPASSFLGTASFTPKADGSIAYQEIGQWNVGGEGMRAYSYRPRDTMLEIFFADGRDAGKLFLSLDFKETGPGVWEAQAQHFCPTYKDSNVSDVYDAWFCLKGGNTITIRYKVSGPEKEYETQTHLTRL